MISIPRRRLLALTTAFVPFGSLLARVSDPIAANARVDFPLTVERVGGPLGSIELQPSGARLSALTMLEDVTMTDVLLPGGRRVDLELQRVRLDTSTVELWVDGERVPAGIDAGDLTLWKGGVAGSDDSEVFVGFSSHGSHGWIRDEGGLVHLLAAPGPGGDWSRSTARLVTDDALLVIGPGREGFCDVDSLAFGPGAEGEPISVGKIGGVAEAGVSETLECPVAVETDYQLFQVFGNLQAEQNYVLTLLGALSDRYLEQINTVLSYPYLAFYTTSNDPWTTQESGGSSGDLLNEFRAAWAFNIPNGAKLAHFLSGANLGGGVAWLNVICNEDFGFGVSGNLNGGVDFPAQQGSGNWDFYVVAHEIGHNFGSVHTHEYCPPLDECAPSNTGWGQCQDETTCASTGTIMSYCHLCAGGTANITTYFHPTVVDVMRQTAESSCLDALCAGPGLAYCVGAANSQSADGAFMSKGGTTSLASNDLQLWVEDSAVNKSGLFYYGSTQIQIAFGDGFRCVGAGGLGTFRLGPATMSDVFGFNSRSIDFSAPPMAAGPGAITAGSSWNFQYWFRDPQGGPAGFNLSDALSLTFCP